MSNTIDFQRLSYLGDKLKSGFATKQEQDEYMLILYKNSKITEDQYNKYLADENTSKTNEIINAALAIGAILLIGYLISEMLNDK